MTTEMRSPHYFANQRDKSRVLATICVGVLGCSAPSPRGMTSSTPTGIVVWSQETNLHETIAWTDLTHSRTGHVELGAKVFEVGPPNTRAVWFQAPSAVSSPVWSLTPARQGGVGVTEVPHGPMVPVAVYSDSTRAVVCAEVCWIAAVSAGGFGAKPRVAIDGSGVPYPKVHAWPRRNLLIIERDSQLFYVDATTGKSSPVPRIETPPETVSSDGEVVAWVDLRGSSRGVVSWSGVDGAATKSVTIEGTLVDCSFTRSASVLACVAAEGGIDAPSPRLYVIDTSTASLHELARDLAQSGTYGVVGSPDGRFLAVPVRATGGAQLVSIEIATGRRVPLSPVVERIHGTGWISP